jgi:CPA1 family monovalent cation:H+ antiporter
LFSAIIIFITLVTRYISVYIPSIAVRLKERINQNNINFNVGGLRGGISIALALSINPEYNKDIWVTITYVIVCFSILVQGMTIGKFAQKMK